MFGYVLTVGYGDTHAAIEKNSLAIFPELAFSRGSTVYMEVVLRATVWDVAWKSLYIL